MVPARPAILDLFPRVVNEAVARFPMVILISWGNIRMQNLTDVVRELLRFYTIDRFRHSLLRCCFDVLSFHSIAGVHAILRSLDNVAARISASTLSGKIHVPTEEPLFGLHENSANFHWGDEL